MYNDQTSRSRSNDWGASFVEHALVKDSNVGMFTSHSLVGAFIPMARDTLTSRLAGANTNEDGLGFEFTMLMHCSHIGRSGLAYAQERNGQVLV